MAESIISPAVYLRENDISFIAPAPANPGAAFIGPAVKGVIEIPTTVTSYNDYVRKFGETFISGGNSYEFLTSIAVRNYFSQGGRTALIVRVASGSHSSATSTNIYSGDAFATGSGTFAANSADKQQYAVSYAGTVYTFIATGSNATDLNTTNTWGFLSGSTATATVASLVDKINSLNSVLPVSASNTNAVLNLTSSFAGTDGNSINFLTGSAAGAAPSFNLFTLGGGTDLNTITFKTIGKGELYNNATSATSTPAANADGSLVSGSADNLRVVIQNVNEAQGTFTVVIRQGNDNTQNPTILETFTGVNLDPNSDNYISKVIGDQYYDIETDSSTELAYVATKGDFVNKSRYIRVDQVLRKTPNYLSNDGVTVNTDATGKSYSTYLPKPTVAGFYGGEGKIPVGGEYMDNIGQTSPSKSQGLSAADYSRAITILENRDDYQFNIVSAPGALQGTSFGTVVNSRLISLAENRGDCIAVVDLVKKGEVLLEVTKAAAELNSSYAATYWPWVQVRSATGKNVFVPAGTVIPGVYAFTDNAAAPWFAPAGLTRGGLAGVIQAERKLSKTDRDTLYAGKVNPIATFPGAGISVFGQKTLQTKASALDRVNVRRLLIELKKFIGDQAKNLVFEQNSIATRNRFLATVNPYLESVVQREGLYAYRVVMDDTNNTADVVDRNQLVGQIYIQPTRTIEYVVLDFVVEPTGVTFG